MSALAIRTWSHVHAGKWLVIRVSDLRVVYESYDALRCLRWVDTWGESLGLTKRGTPLSTKVRLP